MQRYSHSHFTERAGGDVERVVEFFERYLRAKSAIHTQHLRVPHRKKARRERCRLHSRRCTTAHAPTHRELRVVGDDSTFNVHIKRAPGGLVHTGEGCHHPTRNLAHGGTSPQKRNKRNESPAEYVNHVSHAIFILQERIVDATKRCTLSRMRRLIVSACAHARRAQIQEGVRALTAHGEALIVGANTQAATDALRESTTADKATFGRTAISFRALAGALAASSLAERGIVVAPTISLDAVATRVCHIKKIPLGRFEGIARLPGFPRALADTCTDLRLARVSPKALKKVDADLAVLFDAYTRELAELSIADAHDVFDAATQALLKKHAVPIACDIPIFLLDVPLRSESETSFASALAKVSPTLLATTPMGDVPSLTNLRLALQTEEVVVPPIENALTSVKRSLFERNDEPVADSDSVVLFSAPGENRECIEIARAMIAEAKNGTRFDQMAVLLRNSDEYSGHLTEALERAGIESYFARGTTRPNRSGRAFMALVACALDGLSAKRFSEYLSLGQVPSLEKGAPPDAAPSSDRWVPADEDFARILPASPAPDEARPREPSHEEPTFRAPRLWEKLVVDAAVIGGIDRWRRRLSGLRHSFELDAAEFESEDDPARQRVMRDIEMLDHLRTFAIPLLEDLDRLPKNGATWGEWIDALSALATRSLMRPEGVLSILSSLQPMAPVGNVSLHEVKMVLEPRLGTVREATGGKRFGKVFIGSIEEARGMAFEVVFIPGLAEKMFPRKLAEDPLLLDEARRSLDASLATNTERAQDERLYLRLAIGAAKRRVFLSYPRLDVEQARPRTPSFYALDVHRFAHGGFVGFEDLAIQADAVAEARVGWPAPKSPDLAIDNAEHDLALLDAILRKPQEETVGAANYLLSANPHLSRALWFRGYRWLKKWSYADGLVDPSPEAKEALVPHLLTNRSFSPTALQHYAACPYRFLLSAIYKLSPREVPEGIEELDPLQRGSLVHETLFELMTLLSERKMLPITHENIDEVQRHLDEVLARVSLRFKEELCPAIERVWDDGIAGILGDLREWVRRAAASEWVPAHFELSFGLTDRRAQDKNSVKAPVALDCGIKMRGSIDLVEQLANGNVRATDYKTGKARATADAVIGGGEVLQPAFYALVLEKLLPGPKVESGRLYYCTHAADFADVTIPLDIQAREGAMAVATTIGGALNEAFLPAAPKAKACDYCDFRPVCGPYEETRTRMKKNDRLKPLEELRKRP